VNGSLVVDVSRKLTQSNFWRGRPIRSRRRRVIVQPAQIFLVSWFPWPTILKSKIERNSGDSGFNMWSTRRNRRPCCRRSPIATGANLVCWWYCILDQWHRGRSMTIRGRLGTLHARGWRSFKFQCKLRFRQCLYKCPLPCWRISCALESPLLVFSNLERVASSFR